ncbi:MAG: hypothetical protein M1828_005207 [Chrysothrix sp. TS-e1954]|nr:MAG: hypothetical protein M1828_005207 [Chrysothrix sp. TS-e1954]
MSTATIDDLPWLSKRDINVLWDIVKLAEGSSDTPYRALFAAYDSVLDDNGINKNQDQIYFRFLLRMRRGLVPEADIRSQFEALLLEHGVQIKFYRPNDNDVQAEETAEIDLQSEETDITREEVQTPARRASFTSLYDQDPSQYSLQPELQHKLPVRPRSQNTAFDLQRYSAKNVRFQSTEQLYSPIRQARHSRPATPQATAPDLFELEVEAKAHRFKHLAARACTLFRHWHTLASARRQRSTHLTHLAESKYAATLKGDALEQWRAVLSSRLQARETENFFDTLEKKAQKAYDLFLLTKAFTHWAQATSDEIARTSAARRHVLRTRYFNAWRDITVVNELKVRRVQLSRVFTTWRRRSSLLRSHAEVAQSTFESRITATAYRQLFWTFCDRRAPVWYGNKLRIQYFERWRLLTQQSTIRQRWGTDFAQLKLLRNVLLRWAARSSAVGQDTERALAFRSRWLLGPAIESLSREVQLAPLQHQVSHAADARVLRAVLAIWSDKARRAAVAARINETRLMRNAWTAWNDRLRCRVMQRTIDDRVLVQILYRWVLAERCALFNRVAEERQKSWVLGRWADKLNRVRIDLGQAESTLLESNQRRSAVSVLRHWSARTRDLANEHYRAYAIRNQHLASNTLSTWSNRSKQLTDAAGQAQDASEYCLTKHLISLWRAKTKETQKAKRRRAYLTVRNHQHSRLLSTCIDSWKQQSTRIAEDTQLATSTYQAALLEIGTDIFSAWRERSYTILETHAEAEVLDHRRLLKLALHAFINRFQRSREQQSEAESFAAGTRDAARAAVLRRLNWQLFQIRRHRETAESLDTRNLRKRRRAILRHWVERVRQRRDASDARSDPVTNDAGLMQQPSGFRASFRASTTSSSRLPTGIATPAYLKTPSRRPGKARIQTQVNEPLTNTPATTQITPFMNRIQAQYSTGQVRSAKGDFARRLARSRGIEGVPEASPPADRGG